MLEHLGLKMGYAMASYAYDGPFWGHVGLRPRPAKKHYKTGFLPLSSAPTLLLCGFATSCDKTQMAVIKRIGTAARSTGVASLPACGVAAGGC